MPTTTIMIDDARRMVARIPDGSVQCCVTSPPYYGQRNYEAGTLEVGSEDNPDEYVIAVAEVLLEVQRALKPDGTLWLNVGDAYGGNKNLLGLPWSVAFALQAGGWILRQEIIWSKTACMPESVTDRPTRSHEQIFLFSKSPTYKYDAAAISEPIADSTARDRRDPSKAGRPERGFPGQASRGGHLLGGHATRNRRTVWSISPQPYKGAHHATFPIEIPDLCIRAGTEERDIVLDPFGGAGTTALVANRLNRDAILCELNPTTAALARERITADAPMFNVVKMVGGALPLGLGSGSSPNGG